MSADQPGNEYQQRIDDLSREVAELRFLVGRHRDKFVWVLSMIGVRPHPSDDDTRRFMEYGIATCDELLAHPVDDLVRQHEKELERDMFLVAIDAAQAPATGREEGEPNHA
jgi:hypothetical protein